MTGRGTSKGYVFAVCRNADDSYICGVLHVERDGHTWIYETDEDAARAAERDGVKLLYGIPYVQDGIYLDTSENRRILSFYSREMQRTLLNKAAVQRGNELEGDRGCCNYIITGGG